MGMSAQCSSLTRPNRPGPHARHVRAGGLASGPRCRVVGHAHVPMSDGLPGPERPRGIALSEPAPVTIGDPLAPCPAVDRGRPHAAATPSKGEEPLNSEGQPTLGHDYCADREATLNRLRSVEEINGQN